MDVANYGDNEGWEVPWNDLDVGVGPMVRKINNAGYRTFRSSNGQMERPPFVCCEWVDDIPAMIERLVMQGMVDFTVNQRWEVGAEKVRRFVVVELWEAL